MATETAFRPYVDQENAQALNIKGGTTGRSFGDSKSFQSNNAPLATPRRALGDVGNTIHPGTAKARKGLALKPHQPYGKTPLATKSFQSQTGTPTTKGLPLLQQISSVGLKQSSKQKRTSQIRTTGKQKVKPRDPCQREVMYPFAEQEDVLPRSSYVSAILKNVGALYHGCMVQPHSFPASNSEDNASNLVHFEEERRPMKGTSGKSKCHTSTEIMMQRTLPWPPNKRFFTETDFMDSLPIEGDLGSLTQDFNSHSLPEIELPPVDLDSLVLDLF